MFEAGGATWGLPDPDFGGDDLPADKTTLAVSSDRNVLAGVTFLQIIKSEFILAKLE